MIPGWLLVFVVAQCLAHGSTLAGPHGLRPRTDAPRTSGSYRVPTGYLAWTSPRWNAVARGDACRVHVFALVEGGRRARLRFRGQEQVLDASWSFEVRVPAGKRWASALEFIDPVTHESVVHEVAVNCWPAEPNISKGTALSDNTYLAP